MAPNPSRNLWCRQRGLGGFRGIVLWLPVGLAFWAIVALLVVVL
jgi:hypothetical protein